jgi:hypothetical protein
MFYKEIILKSKLKKIPALPLKAGILIYKEFTKLKRFSN